MTEEQRRPAEDDEAASIRRSFSIIGAELCNVLQIMAPTEAQEHFRSARVEALKGIRALIDRRIDRLTREPKKGTSIAVE